MFFRQTTSKVKHIIRIQEYTMQKNWKQDAPIGEKLRKGMAVMGQVWGIGKRRIKRLRQEDLFDVLVCTVIGYNVEIWG